MRDKRPVGGSAPREKSTPGRAVLWNAVEVLDEEEVIRGDRRRSLATSLEGRASRHGIAPDPEKVWGSYPKGFLVWAVRQLGVWPSEVLHVCSGSLDETAGGVRVDMRQVAAPTVRADGRALPFRDASFKAVLLDPPYSVEYAEDLYQTDYPRPSHLLAEAARVVRPCGKIGFLHFLLPFPPPGCSFVRVKALTQGMGYRIRAFTIFEREQDSLPGVV